MAASSVERKIDPPILLTLFLSFFLSFQPTADRVEMTRRVEGRGDIDALQPGDDDVLSNDRGCRLGSRLVNSELQWKLLNRGQIEIHRSKKRPYPLNAERVEARLFVLSREDKRGTNAVGRVGKIRERLSIGEKL